MVKGFTNSVNIQGSGGDLVYCDNNTGTDLQQDDMVLLHYVTEGGIYTGNPAGYMGTLVLSNNSMTSVDDIYNKSKNFMFDVNNTLVQTASNGDNCAFDQRFPISLLDNNTMVYWLINSSKHVYYDLANMIKTEYEKVPLTDDLVYNVETGVIESLTSEDTFNTGWENNRDHAQDRIHMLKNGDLVNVRTDKVSVVKNLAQFPNVTKVDYSYSNDFFTQTFDRNWGVTGTNVGDYVICSNNNNIYFLKFTETGFQLDFQTTCKHSERCLFNYSTGIFTFVSPSNELVIYKFNSSSKSFNQVDIPSQVQSIYEEWYNGYTSEGWNYSTPTFTVNKDCTIFGISYINGMYSRAAKAIKVELLSSPVLTMSTPVKDNFISNKSFTGYITGNTNSTGQYEVKTILPQTV